MTTTIEKTARTYAQDPNIDRYACLLDLATRAAAVVAFGSFTIAHVGKAAGIWQ